MTQLRQWIGVVVFITCAAGASGQVPDLMTSFHAGAKALGMGGASAVTDTNTLSPINNPATLAYADRVEYGVSMRNFPTSTTQVAGSFVSPAQNTFAEKGRLGFSHIGAIVPLAAGTLGVSYSVGGYIDDTTFGDNLTAGSLTVRNLTQTTRAQTNFLTVAYGKPGSKYNIGLGLVVAQESIRASQSYLVQDAQGNAAGGTVGTVQGDQYGFGVVAGIQSVPSETENTTWGASVRTPIKLKGNDDTNPYVSTVPGQLSIGVSQRRPGRAETEEFLMLAGQLDYSFGGSGSDVLGRNNTLGLGLGGEYNLYQNDIRVPLRLGYSYVPGGGGIYQERSSFTFGIGYKPRGQDFGVDLSFAKPTNGGPTDLALSVSYRPGSH